MDIVWHYDSCALWKKCKMTGLLMKKYGRIRFCWFDLKTNIMISWHECTFCITSPLCRESTSHQWVLWMQDFDTFFVVILNKLFIKQSSGQWFEMPWDLCDITVINVLAFFVLQRLLDTVTISSLYPHCKHKPIANLTQYHVYAIKLDLWMILLWNLKSSTAYQISKW